MRPRRSARITQRVIATVLLCVVMTTCAPASSWGYWASTASPAAPELKTAQVPVPAGVACATVYPSFSLTRVARLTWNTVPGATGYQIWVTDSARTTRILLTTTTATTIDLNSNLLSGLVSTLLQTLLGGQPVYAEVAAVHRTGWVSSPSERKPFLNDGLVGGLLGGIRCGP